MAHHQWASEAVGWVSGMTDIRCWQGIFSATIILQCLKATPMSHLGALPKSRWEKKCSRTTRRRSVSYWSELRSLNPEA